MNKQINKVYEISTNQFENSNPKIYIQFSNLIITIKI